VTSVYRPYQPGDREALISLWSLCGLTRPWNDPYRDIARKLAVDPDDLILLDEGNQLIGSVMVGYEGHRGWVNYLAVHPNHQHQGIGRGLMSEAEKRLDLVGCPKVNLQVRASNQAAVEFYRRIGYTIDEVVSMSRRLEDDSPPADPPGDVP
jgi:ribosomal protein S18 acetylase RimI-like enzyme